MMTDATDIAILGGGPVGLAAALLLARAGFAPTVYDARPAAAEMARTVDALVWRGLASLPSADDAPR